MNDLTMAKLWVLLVGVNQYRDRNFPSLQYSAIDCQGLADAFTQATQSFAEKTIKIHHDSAISAATLGSVRRSLQQIVEQAKVQDTVVIYFCGHGGLESKLQQAVLCFADTEREDLLKSGLSAMSLLGMLGNCAAKQQVLWLDVCHGSNNPLNRNALPLDDPTWQLHQMLNQHALANPQFCALLSCDRAQQSWISPEFGRSIFAHFLIEGLEGQAADRHGFITATQLANYVCIETIQQSSENQPKHLVQTPKRIGKGEYALGTQVKVEEPIIPAQEVHPESSVVEIPPESRDLQNSEFLENSEFLPHEASLPTTPELVQDAATSPEPTPEIPAADLQPEPIAPIPEEPVLPLIDPPQPEPIAPIPEEPVQIQEPPTPEEPELQWPIAPSFPVMPTPREKLPEPPPPPVKRRTKRKQAAFRKLSRSTQRHLHQTAIALSEFGQSTRQLVNTQRRIYRQRSEALRHQLIAKIRALDESTRAFTTKQAANTRSFANSTRQTLGRSTQELGRTTQALTQKSMQELGKTTQALKQRTRERSTTPKATPNPQISKVLLLTAGGVGVAGCTLGGFLYTQNRSTQLNEILASATASETALASNPTLALSDALKAGSKLQDLDTPWNFVPETVKLGAIASLQQAIARVQDQVPTGLSSGLSKISVSPDGKTFALATPDHSIQLWQRDGDQFERLNTVFKGHQATITGIQFSPDGKYLVSGSDDKTMKLWDLEKGILMRTLEGHKDRITAISFRPDSDVLASASADKTIKLWSIPKGELVDTLTGHEAEVLFIRFSPDGKLLAIGNRDSTLHVWYPDSPKPILLGRHNLSAFKEISALAFSPDGKTIASASYDKTIKFWTISDAKPEQEATARQTLSGHRDRVTSLTFSPSGETLASGSQDTTLKLWDAQTGKLLRTLDGHLDPVATVAFRPDGKALLSASDRTGLVIWNLDLDDLMRQGCAIAKNEPKANQFCP
jgi:WD40 repeat protein